jgi:hypothetical protein
VWNMRRHVKTQHHAQGPLMCGICDLVFQAKHFLHAHARNVHDDKGPILQNCFSVAFLRIRIYSAVINPILSFNGSKKRKRIFLDKFLFLSRR